jgi:signal transduction histidine kinase
MFSWLLMCQWVLAVILASTLTPLTWVADSSSIHPHVFMALIFGGVLTVYPVYQLRVHPGHSLNRFIACIAQISYSTLLIHLTGGRIETHFHIFGSLAFLAFYLDTRVIILATIMTATDHFLRGLFFPESIYGVFEATFYRAFEHSAWVVFEDIFLIISINSGIKGIREVSAKEHSLDMTIANIERLVEERTEELKNSQRLVLEQQESMVNSSRLSALGEMAAGIAHEINNPLAVISNLSRFIKKKVTQGKSTDELILSGLSDVDETVTRISTIIHGLRNLSRDSSVEELSPVALKAIFGDVLAICTERFRNHSVDFSIVDNDNLMGTVISCRQIQISQVILNLLTNSFDAVCATNADEKWIKIEFVQTIKNEIEIRVSDSGPGVPESIKSKIFDPFFTTKDVGKGTGLGLSLSKSIIQKHGGSLMLDQSLGFTQFSITLPKSA